MPTETPIIPDNITVHLGPPDSNAENVTLPFMDYIANVASSEIYPTWPESALRANIYAQISFALNRIYTEYYRSRGYNFDITNSTAFDQSFNNGRDIFENIENIVGEIFNSYVRRQGSVEPLFTAYCNGTSVTCQGLSQWGTVNLANQGYTPYQILQYYYGDNIDIITDVPVGSVNTTAPTIPLQIGIANNETRTVQLRLNRISSNYPSIPKIVNTDGVFDTDTEEAVKAFQRIFGLTPDGIVGQATWYMIRRIYNAVKRLNELDSEGLKLDDVTKQYPNVLTLGDRTIGVANLQYYINYLSQFYTSIPSVEIDGTFGEETLAAVIDIQNTFGLTPDGVVGPATWDAIYDAYLGIIEKIPSDFREGQIIPFGGVVLRFGSEGEAVKTLQEYINYIAQSYPQISSVSVTGYFGEMTQSAVRTIQQEFGFPPTGIVEATTWDAISNLYSDLYIGNRLGAGQYPGAPIGQ